MGFCSSTFNCLLFMVNLIIALAGLALIGVGAYIYQSYSDFSQIGDTPLAAPPIVIMVIGSIVFVIAFLGCCGASSNSACMLNTYATFLFLILAAQIALAIYVLAKHLEPADILQPVLYKEFKATGRDEAAFRSFEELQKELKCCGVVGPTDYVTYPNLRLANSCPSIASPGCATVLGEQVIRYSGYIGGVGIGLAAFELIGAIAGFCLARKS